MSNDHKHSSKQWLTLIDAEKSSGSLQRVAKYFRTAISREQWLQSLGAARRTLGDLVCRNLKNVTYTKSVTSEPDSEYMVLHFETSFANGEMAY